MYRMLSCVVDLDNRDTELMDMPVKNRDEIGFCGIHCGDCILGKGASKENAQQILEEIRDLDMDNWQDQLPKQEPFNYDDFKKGMDIIKAEEFLK